MRDYARFWLLDPAASHRWDYSSWIVTGLVQLMEIDGSESFAVGLLDGAVAYYRGWDDQLRHGDSMGGNGNGTFLASDEREGTELSLSGNGIRPLFASAMYSEAVAIATLAKKAGRYDLSEEFRRKAEVNRRQIIRYCWNDRLQFFTVASRAGEQGVIRELHGYAPWYFGMPTGGRRFDVSQLLDPQGFCGSFGLTFVERRAKGWTIDYTGHECKWNGPSWPFATSIALTSYSNWLHEKKRGCDASTFCRLLTHYAAQHKRYHHSQTEGDDTCVSWIDENCHPDKCEWIARKIIEDSPRLSATFPKERGKDYNHSTFCDLVINGLVGFLPNDADRFTVDPLFPETWDYCLLEGLRYRGHDVDIRWVRDKREFSICVDGIRVHRATGLLPLRVCIGKDVL